MLQNLACLHISGLCFAHLECGLASGITYLFLPENPFTCFGVFFSSFLALLRSRLLRISKTTSLSFSFVRFHSLLQICVTIHHVQSILSTSCPPEANGIGKRKTKLSNATNLDGLMFLNSVVLTHTRWHWRTFFKNMWIYWNISKKYATNIILYNPKQL